MESQCHDRQDRNDAVVPVSAHNPLLYEALRSVEAQAHTLTGAGPLAIAFYHWVLGEKLAVEQCVHMAQELCDEIAGSGRSIQAVAALGFLAIEANAARPSAMKIKDGSARDGALGRWPDLT